MAASTSVAHEVDRGLVVSVHALPPADVSKPQVAARHHGDVVGSSTAVVVHDHLKWPGWNVTMTRKWLYKAVKIEIRILTLTFLFLIVGFEKLRRMPCTIFNLFLT